MIPPQAVELEEAVLGAIMLERDAYTQVAGILSEDIFYKDAHTLIYQAIKDLADRNEPIDLLTVSSSLRKSGNLEKAGGAYYVTELTSKVASAANIEHHVRIIQEMAIKRQTIKLGMDLMRIGYDDTSDAFELVDSMQRGHLNILEKIDNGRTKDFKSIWIERLQEIGVKMETSNSGHLTGVNTGFKIINSLTGGWQKPDLIILAARPAMGKTALALNFITGACDSGIPVAFFSLEMSESQIADRLFAQKTRIASSQDLNRGNITSHQYEGLMVKSEAFLSYNLHIDDTSAISISQLRSKAYKLKATQNIGLIVVDYLQLMKGEGKGNREQEVAQISGGLKNIARDLQIPVIALSQLSRSVEQRGGDKRPQLSDLRESGSIEQDADIVMFLHRSEYYGVTEDSQGNSLAGVGEVIFAKHRNGATDNVLLKWIGHFMDFRDLESESEQSKIPTTDFNYGNNFKSIQTTDF